MPLDPELNFDWPMPALSDVADLPLVFRRFADTLADDLTTSGKLTYTPTWQTVPGQAWPGSPTNQPGGGVTRKGVYTTEKFAGMIFVTATIQFNSGAYGAYGGLSIGLPTTSVIDVPMQTIACTLYTPSTVSLWSGVGIIDAGSSVVRPHFPISNSRAAEQLPWTSSANSWTNSSIPIVSQNNPGASCIEAGGWICVSGAYRNG